MNRSKGLTPVPLPPRTKELARNTPLTTRAPLRAVRSTRGGQVRNMATRNSGPTPEVRRLVLERDGYCCFCCGQSIIGQRYSLGHRLRASQGGKAVPSNLITLLGWGGEQHHGRIDRRDDPRDEDYGFTVRSYQDPALVPVNVLRPDGSRVHLYLWDDGTRRDYPQSTTAGAA
jgi:hypothetical protein